MLRNLADLAHELAQAVHSRLQPAPAATPDQLAARRRYTAEALQLAIARHPASNPMSAAHRMSGGQP